MQQNSKCWLFGNKDETIHHIMSECSKLTQKKYKTIHVWVGQVINRELCKKLKFDHTTKRYMKKIESVRVNKMHKILWDFVIEMDHQIPARQPDLVLINKKKELDIW